MNCEICQEQKGKYQCPACTCRTCSLECCKEHKKSTGCPGIRTVPKAPSAASEYNEQVFMQDYRFLEALTSVVNKSEGEDGKGKAFKKKLTKREKMLRKVRMVAKLKELWALPETFSRAKRNKTRLVRVNAEPKDSNDKKEEQEEQEEDEMPQMRTTKEMRVAWTVDFIRVGGVADVEELERTGKFTGMIVETKYDILENTLLKDLVNTERIWLCRESRREGSKRHLEEKNLNLSLAKALLDVECIEYPILVYM